MRLLLLLLSLNITAHANELMLNDVDGRAHDFHHFIGTGNWVVVNIWATRCPPCLEELPELSSFHDEFVEKGVEILGLAIDFPSFSLPQADVVADFINDYLISFPVLLVDSNKASNIYGTRLTAVPSSVLFDPQGKRITQWKGSVTYAELVDILRQHGWTQPVKKGSSSN